MLLVWLLALAPAQAGRADVGGYFRVMTRPDLQGGNGSLGYWNLYGRLLNEGPYAALEFRFDVLEPEAGTNTLWTNLHAKIEGGSVGNADAGNGSLSNMRLSQVYVQAGNLAFDHVTWQVGTLDTYFGDLGLYDMRPAEIFDKSVGLSARYQRKHVDLLLGLGDSGYARYGADYNTVFTPGGTARFRIGDHLELGVGGEYRYEPGVAGDTNAPYQTPDIDYEDYLRGEIVQSYFQTHPGSNEFLPTLQARTATSYKAIGYLGFGGFGPLHWDNLFASYEHLHPEKTTTETYEGQDYTIWIHDQTDQRTQLLVGNELDMSLVPRHLDAAWGLLYGDDRDGDNTIAPSDYARTFGSTVLRLEFYATDTVHLLVENSVAREHSLNGDEYREHKDSIFASTDGEPDAEGLEMGDTDTRSTWQGKAGVVLNPLGRGIYTRPSLRLLYGIQYSNQNNAFGNSFVETLDQYSTFDAVEQHWHQLIALETEVWF